jgi:diguanylate cyclase (GGDEF)-like protein
MYPVPLNDAERVSTLRGLHLLDSHGNASFDAIVELVSTTLGGSMAMISLMDEQRQWFLASRGLSVAETPRDVAFCNYPVTQGEPMLVKDALIDPRFAHNPLVQAGPRIRSYAGCPLRAANGSIVGTLCAADQTPEKFTAAQMPLLHNLARVVEHLFVAHTNQQALQRANEIDDLTGLLNRGAFARGLAGMIFPRALIGTGPFLLLFDLNGFKHVNDTYGHVHGDLALEEIGERVRTLVPEGHAGRWGNDVFGVILPATMSDEGVHAFAEDMLELIARPIRISDATLHLRASCGIARYVPGDTSRELLRRAELTIHHGKTQPAQRIHVYNPRLEDREQTRLAAEAEVYAALDTDRIFASYQPIVDLRTRTVKGYEALLRITRTDGRILTAGQLLPALVNPELSRQIAARMSALVAAEFATLAQITPGSCYVSLNATEADLLSDDFAPMLLARLAKAKIEPERVTLEVTETMLFNDLERIKTVLDTLKAQGMSIALDDFGTGFSSLTHLKVFPIDKVKIDRSFVKDITHDHNARSIVAAVIAMARSLSIEVIAEGIEEEAQLQMLLHMGCTMGQGYLLSRPHNIAYHELTWRNAMAARAQTRIAQVTHINEAREDALLGSALLRARRAR